MLVSIDHKFEYRPIRWSFGYCGSCEQEGAVIIERIVEVCYVCGFKSVHEDPRGKAARCDFCHRPVEDVSKWKGIPLDDWSPEEGLPTLLTKLGLPVPAALPQATTDARLHALLTSVQRASSLARVELSPIGAVCGAVAGFLAAISVGPWLYENQIVQPQADETGFVIMLCLGGVVAGIILGATVEVLLKRPRGALARIAAAHSKYHIDLERLEELSRTYSRRIRKAVNKVCAKVTLRN